MQVPRHRLLTLLSQQSFRLGKFKLASGGVSDYYIDCRTTTLHAEGARLTARVFLDEIKRRKWRPQAIGGLTMGADPIVVAVSMLSALEGLLLPADVVPDLIHGFLVRKAEKSHGTGQRVEGFREKGARVVIVDDVCTTGGSTVQAIEAAREFGFDVVAVMCMVEREESQGRTAIEKAANGVPFISIFTATEVRAEHLLHLTEETV
jgi:orotate phosphoribosyltransferase